MHYPRLILLPTALFAVCFLAYLTVALIVFFMSGRDPKSLREVAQLWPWRRK